MQQPTAHVPTPDLVLDEAGTARSRAFDDVYFSERGGIAETEHVFLAGNGLPQRWQDCTHFTIGELGFGTGLNVLVAWKKFMETNATGQLHIISFEKYPLTQAQLRQALAYHPSLAPLARALCESYPLRLPGLHRIHLDRLTLTLCFGDACKLLPQVNASVDAWFLDGFSPAKNPDMWGAPLFHELARLSAPNASVATFTVAGAVRRGLQQAGFTVQKTPGFAHKREMLIGSFSAAALPRVAEGEPPLRGGIVSGSERKGEDCPPSCAQARTVIIIGAGIAGASVAHALAERGMKVAVYEQEQVAHGASGNKVAVLYPQLAREYTAACAWHLSAYGFMLRQLPRWQAQGLDFRWGQPGMLKIAHSAEDEVKLRSIHARLQLDTTIARWVEAEEASALCGQTVRYPGFWFAHGCWLAPAELCRALLQHPNITLHEHTKLHALEKTSDGWRITLANGTAQETTQVVVANAQAAADLLPLRMGVSAGQVSEVRAAVLPVTLRSILCHKGYAVPQPGSILIGATYARGESLTGDVTTAAHRANLDELQRAIPAARGEVEIVGGRTSLRATTPSRLPYAGAWEPGLYVSVGHGSRGMISAPLAAECIASHIAGEPVPLTRSLQRVLGPHRA